MRWNPKDPHAPFDRKGNLQHFPLDEYVYAPDDPGAGRNGYTRVPATWRPVRPFVASLRVNDYGRGRSAAYFCLVDEEGHEWPMFMSDFFALVQRTTLEQGVTPALRWAVRKAGQNYGLALAPDA